MQKNKSKEKTFILSLLKFQKEILLIKTVHLNNDSYDLMQFNLVLL